ncbi:peptide deformylase [Kitasatospora aureofaciens]|uniref:peptide deformylase n=1 Tax=Kitasatospora aureofaciens TaxID=1894 RepID=UPI0033B971C9
MRDLGVVQEGEPVLAEPARAFDLPTEREAAEQVIEKLFTATERIGRAAAIVQPASPDAPTIVLLNPQITDRSDEADEQFEGCLSFFLITVETTALDGQVATTTYERGLARLIHHEIDHLDGLLYTARMAAGVEPIPVEQYRQTGQAWSYER